MTVSALSRRNSYTGNGVTTTFAVTFQFFELQVFAAGVLMTPGVHYTITQSTPGSTGSVTFLSPPIVPVAIVGTTVATQALDLVDNDSAPAELYEGALDRLTMIAQETALLRGQGLRAPPDAAELPTLDFANNPNRIVATNASGVPILADALDVALPFAVPVATATAQAVIATTKAAEAAASAASVSSGAATATAQAALAALAYDNFDDRYLGPKSSGPALDNDANALLIGALYFDTTANEMRVRTPGGWAAIAGGGGTVIQVTAGGGLSGGAITSSGTIALANMPTLTVKGNDTGGTAAPTDLTMAQFKAMLAMSIADIPGLAVAVSVTGMEIDYHGTSAPSGWVLASGRTIGNAASGATERANADTSALFTMLWATYSDAVCPVLPSGRGGSAAADYAANKTIALPDKRGRVSLGKGNMGGTSANRVTTAGSGIDSDTMGASGGTENVTLAQSALPNVALSIATDNPGNHAHTDTKKSYSGVGGGGGNKFLVDATSNVGGITDQVTPTASSLSGGHVHGGSTSSLNGAVAQTAVRTVSPVWVNNKIIKL